MRLFILGLLIMTLAAGCGTTPPTAITWTALEGEGRLIYFEQCDRVPKDVMLVGRTNAQQRMMMGTLSAEAIAELVKQLLASGTELGKTYSAERQNEGYISRRIYIRGYSTNELPDVVKIIDSLGRCIERWD